MKAFSRQYWPTIALFVALLVVWQMAVSFGGIREYLLPSPLAVWNSLWHGEVAWTQHLWVTTWEIVGAFLMAGAVGVALGVAIAWSPLLANALVPFLVFVNTLPKVAIAPLFLIWMGYGIFPNMLMGALIGFFPVVINTAVGLSQVEADMLDLGRVFSAPKWKIFLKIRIPNALPYILSALKITATAAAVGDHAAYWVALDKGYYKSKGLDVTLENSKGSGDSIAKVDSGRSDAGLADAAVVIASSARGTTVKTVGMVFDKTPLNIFSLKD